MATTASENRVSRSVARSSYRWSRSGVSRSSSALSESPRDRVPDISAGHMKSRGRVAAGRYRAGDPPVGCGGGDLAEQLHDVAGDPLDHGGLADSAGVAAVVVVEGRDPVVGAGVEHARAGGRVRVVGDVGVERADAGLAAVGGVR